MRKQFRCTKKSWCKTSVYLYHDSELFRFKEVWNDELEEYIEQIKSEGYMYGYTQEDIERAKKVYENAKKTYEDMLICMIDK